MSHKLDTGAYTSREDFEYDFRLMIGNCKSYNNPETTYYRCADNLDALFDAKMIQLFDGHHHRHRAASAAGQLQQHGGVMTAANG